jgi:hypothetical protein
MNCFRQMVGRPARQASQAPRDDRGDDDAAAEPLGSGLAGVDDAAGDLVTQY